jgi:hypothetical protein
MTGVTETGIAVAEPGVPTKTLDSTQVTTSQGAVQREGIYVADPIDPNARAAVEGSDPLVTDYGEVVRVVVDRGARRAQEQSEIANYDIVLASMTRRHSERVSYTDRRGNVGRGSMR